MAPAWARCCRSSGCAGGVPGRAECSTRFLIQPVMPEENLPPVSVATLGAPPVGMEGVRACLPALQPRRGGRPVLWLCRSPVPPHALQGCPSPGLTNVDAALGVHCHVRAWGLAADQLLTVHLDGAPPALSVVALGQALRHQLPILPDPVRVPSLGHRDSRQRSLPSAPSSFLSPLYEICPTNAASQHPNWVSRIPEGAHPPPWDSVLPGYLCHGWWALP